MWAAQAGGIHYALSGFCAGTTAQRDRCDLRAPTPLIVSPTNVSGASVPSHTSSGPPGRAFFHRRRANSKRRGESFSYRLFRRCHQQQALKMADPAFRSVIPGMERRSSLVRLGPSCRRQRIVPFQRPSITRIIASTGHSPASFFETDICFPKLTNMTVP